MEPGDSDKEIDRSELIAGRFRIISKIGQGAKGEVYEVQDEVLKRKSAVKCLRMQKSDERSILRFQREAKAASKLKHTGLIEVFDFGITDDGIPYLVMEYVNGVALDQLMQQEGSLPVERVLGIISLVAAAMENAHVNKVIHRDLKPSNILIVNPGPGEHIKIVDFGLAAMMDDDGIMMQTMTPSHGFTGTPSYVSPEQAAKTNVDERTDIYSLGCILFELIAGRPPFCAETALRTIEQHINTPPPKLSELLPDANLPPRLVAIVDKMLAKKPQDRFQTMRELKQTIDDFRFEVLPEFAEENRADPQPTKPLRQHPAVRLTALGVLILLVGISTCFFAAPLMVPSGPEKQPEANAKAPANFGDQNSTDSFDMCATLAGAEGEAADTSEVRHMNGEETDDRALSTLVRGNLHLKKIFVSQSMVTDAAVEGLVSFPDLITVHFDYCPKLTDVGISDFKKMKGLGKISVRGSTGITDSGVAGLAEIPTLKEVFLGNNPHVTMRSVRKLANLPQLYELGIGDTGIRGKDFLELKSFDHLIILNLEGSVIGDDDMKYIKELKFLECIILTGSTISDKAVLMMAEMDGLRSIKMAESKGYSAIAVARLKNKLGSRCLLEEKQPYKGVSFRGR